MNVVVVLLVTSLVAPTVSRIKPSLSVKLIAPVTFAANVSMSLLLVSVAPAPASNTSPDELITPVCVISPDKVFPTSPSTTVPVKAVMLPSAAVVPSITRTAVAAALVVVNAPARLIAPVWPSTRMSPVPPSTTLPFKLVTPTPVRLTPTPVTLFVPSAKAPPAVVISAAPVPLVVTAPVKVKPPALSFKVNAPFVVNAPKLVRTFAPPKVTVDAVLPVKVFAVITSVCVTAPVMSPPTPKMTVPVAPTPTVTVSIATVLASCIVTAAAPTLVVVKSPARLIAPVWPSTKIVSLPASTVIPPFTVKPPAGPPVRLTAPVAVVMSCATVKPAEPNKVTVPLVVVKVPPVANTPPSLRNSILPVPVDKAAAGIVNTVPAIAVKPVFAPKVGAASVKAFTSRIEAVAPVAFKVTAPIKSFVVELKSIVPAPALITDVVPTVTVLAPA